MSDRQAARVPFYCLSFLGVVFIAIMGTVGTENQRLLTECKPVHGVAQCELKILGR
jgi:hypothetical protein